MRKAATLLISASMGFVLSGCSDHPATVGQDAGGGGDAAAPGGSDGAIGMAPDASIPDGAVVVPSDAAVVMPPPQSTLDPDIMGIISQVSATNLANNITTLVGFGTRNSCSDNSGATPGIGAARDWLQQQYMALGLQVQADSFQMTGCAQAQTDQNIVAWIPGTGHKDRLILLTGHYDSRNTNVVDGTQPAPGANDSGSQTSLVLEAARVLAGHTFDATLVFVAFAGEEQGLIGSAHLATTYTSIFGANAKVEAVLNSDIVGGDKDVNDATTLQQFRLYSPGTPREASATAPDGTTDDTSPARGLMRTIAFWGSGYVPSMTIVPMLRQDRPGRGSDHIAFLNQAYPGVRFIETKESLNAGTIASHQHSPNDLFMYVTPDYTARVAKVVVSIAAELARAPSTPQSMTASGNATGPVMVNWTAPATGSAVDHYVIGARDMSENFYHTRVVVPAGSTSKSLSASDLGITGSTAFYLSVGAVDAKGHESMFAYPEYRCDGASCVVPPGSLDVTATQ